MSFRRFSRVSFQFIEFPSEWGAAVKSKKLAAYCGFQFIEFPSEWGDAPVVLE